MFELKNYFYYCNLGVGLRLFIVTKTDQIIGVTNPAMTEGGVSTNIEGILKCKQQI